MLAHGDSWFDYPLDGNSISLPHTDIIAQLEFVGNINPCILNISQWGDATTAEMSWPKQQKMITALQDNSNWLESGKPDAILFSGGGNDVAGDQCCVFLDYANPAPGGLNKTRFEEALGMVKASAMARGFVYLAVALDWFSRRVLAWRLSITMEAAFCIETLEDALARYGKPEIFNTDQGSQFTGQTFTGALAGNGVAISMDGKGAWRDNVFVERLWRSVKYEEVYLRAYDSVSEARASIGRYFDFYNGRRPHASLDGNTPDQAYFNPLPIRMAA